MTKPTVEALLTTALHAVECACIAADSIQSSFDPADALTKHDDSPVTTADYTAQTVITSILADAFPALGMVSEENADELRKAENRPILELVALRAGQFVPGLTPDSICEILARPDGSTADVAWVLDPIDGTKGFLRGEQYAIALALIERGRVVLGVMGCPRYAVDGTRQGSIFWARRGAGAHARRLGTDAATTLRLHVHGERPSSDLRIVRGVEVAHANFGVTDLVRQDFGMARPDIRMDGQGKYAAVASGDATAYLRIPRAGSTRRESIWDHAAGVILVEEAGGRVSDIHGAPLDFSLGATLAANTGIVASNGLVHDAMLAAIRRHEHARG